MKHIEPYREPEKLKALAKRLHDIPLDDALQKEFSEQDAPRDDSSVRGRTINLMEVCGTHTMSIARMGIRTILGEKLRLVSGPGCPVCVTSEGDIVRSIHLAGLPGVIVTTFGDMMRVPGGGKSLFDAKAGGADVRIIYSPTDSLKIAEDNPDKQVVFLAVGFETTIPSIAATVELAGKRNLSNFSILPMMKLVPPALRLLCEHPELAIDGFILPGHVSTIIGHQPYRFIVEDFGIPSVITGFTDRDIADGLLRMSAMLASGAAMADQTWSGTTSTDFEVGTNWVSGTAPVDDTTTDLAVFVSPVPANQPLLTTNRSVKGLQFNSGTWSIFGSGTVYQLDLGASGVDNNGSANTTLGASATLGITDAATKINTHDNNLVMKSKITGTGGIELEGTLKNPTGWGNRAFFKRLTALGFVERIP